MTFWARRQAAVAAEEAAEEQAQIAVERAARDEAVAEKSDEDLLAELNLPEPESLKAGDDFKVFLDEQVPARIKTRALRHLWRANPVLACVDGLVDYGEDFTDAALVLEGMQTAYQVGKGMTLHVDALAREAAQAEQDAAQQVDLADAQPVEQSAEHSESAEPTPSVDAAGQVPLADKQTPDWEHVVGSPAPVGAPDPRAEMAPSQHYTALRRMRFSFEGTLE
ncbi:DUF3306 domain-containing protein [Pseudophaeobacter flagellatus]|uniref:DUF3306 domain-containing protein n=1 Tax=Pseudophaeobacter flagellatus TaxID=2899119 RepID=UPI001E651370|nr:DUF3306 domain-containing protein [Pseudophaeobacter flagellatus]MCD9148317.1 DUF3306 domain-containing protein [Pseudophaeobacter flagellatus]